MPPLGAIMAGAKKLQRLARLNAKKQTGDAGESTERDGSESSGGESSVKRGGKKKMKTKKKQKARRSERRKLRKESAMPGESGVLMATDSSCESGVSEASESIAYSECDASVTDDVERGGKKKRKAAQKARARQKKRDGEASDCEASDSSGSDVSDASSDTSSDVGSGNDSGDNSSSAMSDGSGRESDVNQGRLRKITYAVVATRGGETTSRGTAKARKKQHERQKRKRTSASSGPTAPASSGPRYVPQQRAHRKNPRSEMEEIAAAAKAKGIETETAAFHFPPAKTFAEFDANLAAFCNKEKCMLSTRSSNGRDAWNVHLTAQFEKKKQTALAKGHEFKDELHVLPPEMLYYQRVYQCVHSEYSKSKSVSAGKPGEKPKRYQAATLYTDCTGRITARAKRGDDGVWLVWPIHENVFHNHCCNQDVYDSYRNDSTIDDEVLFEIIRSQFSVGGDSRAMRDQLSAEGEPMSSSQFSNLKHYQFGRGDAQENMELLLGQLESTTDARCLLIHDQDNRVTGVLFQTGIQREYVRRFGDNLVLDWTHNTNNVGLHLGSLMATSLTGKGVPVYNFLCLSQGVDTMTTVLRLFLDGSPGVGDLLESVVIDKDYKEWKALNIVFEGVTVVLCQFHVLKWFKTVVADARYNIGKSERPTVLKLVRRMLYAETDDAFEAVQGKLHDLLSDDEGHPAFHKYMEARWYAIQHMWANYKRGRVFTAGNTTSNRLESHWNQLKALLRKYKRLDKCVEAVIIRECTIVRREFNELSRASTRTPLLYGDDNFMKPLLRDLCTSRMELVREQWVKYQARMQKSRAKYYTNSSTGSVHSIGVNSQSDMKFVVKLDDAAPWECSCRFASSHHLPCRHQFFVAQEILQREVFPVEAVNKRWRVSAHVDLVRLLAEASEELSPIRLTLPEWKTKNTSTTATARVKLPVPFKKVKIVSVPRRKVGGFVVLEATEKRNIVESQCAAVVSRMMRLGTERFWKEAANLEDAVTAFLARLEVADAASDGVVPASSAATGEVRAPSDGEHQEADVPGHESPTDELMDGRVMMDESEYGNVAFDCDASDDDDEEDEGGNESVQPVEQPVVQPVLQPVPPPVPPPVVGCDPNVAPNHSNAPYVEADGGIDMLWGSQILSGPGDTSLMPVPYPFSPPAPVRYEDIRFVSQPSQLDESSTGTHFSPEPQFLSPMYQDGVCFLSDGASQDAMQWTWPESSLWESATETSTPSLHYMMDDTAAATPDPDTGTQLTPPAQSKKREASQDREDSFGSTRVKKIRKGIFGEFSLPKPTSGAPRNSKQLAGKAKRLVVVHRAPACSVPVDQFLAGVRHSNLSVVADLVARYPCRDDVDVATRNGFRV